MRLKCLFAPSEVPSLPLILHVHWIVEDIEPFKDLSIQGASPSVDLEGAWRLERPDDVASLCYHCVRMKPMSAPCCWLSGMMSGWVRLTLSVSHLQSGRRPNISQNIFLSSIKFKGNENYALMNNLLFNNILHSRQIIHPYQYIFSNANIGSLNK